MDHSLSINPVGGVGGLQPSDFCSEADDMCVSFGSLGEDRAASFFDGMINVSYLVLQAVSNCGILIVGNDHH